MVIVCVDGGLPNTVSTWNFFSPHRRFPDAPDSGAVPLRSVFPSSTAPAHASFLTGVPPADHGIVGNRFWDGESVAEIRERAADPIRTIHPYEARSLTAPSLIDWLTGQGASVEAIHFPHTFSRGEAVSTPALYCLYAPAREVRLGLRGALRESVAPVTYFDREVPLRVRSCKQANDAVVLGWGHDDETFVTLKEGETARTSFRIDAGPLSVPITCLTAGPDDVRLRLGTAVLTMRFGGMPTHSGAADGPSSLAVEYTAASDHNFHESPRAEWIRDAALKTLADDDPDVLLVRFNQADHAQEYLYWYAARGEGRTAASARQQILDTYQRIDHCVDGILSAAGPETDYIIFSDHGIDYVEDHLRPNAVLRDLGLGERMVFQGDSNVAYLYADTRPEDAVLDTVYARLRSLDPSIDRIDADAATELGLPWGSVRLGRLAVTCGAHREFHYDADGAATEKVRSASHGHLPATPSMYGFFRMFGPHTAHAPVPSHICEVFETVRQVWLG
ncbi:alkaline phosphatase family protein [Streptomyces sp. NPDC088726]|uniref:alkaline phosphatase family protein n=1 Tax=Streptomyces sp. NPDC088726 TaxID=3365874 RepID=UPI00381154D8